MRSIASAALALLFGLVLCSRARAQAWDGNVQPVRRRQRRKHRDGEDIYDKSADARWRRRVIERTFRALERLAPKAQ